MATYKTLDYLTPLSPGQITSAGHLDFPKTSPDTVGGNYLATAFGREPTALAHSVYSFNATAGATLDLFSTSYFEPFNLKLFDAQGRVIATNDVNAHLSGPISGVTYGVDSILGYVAPYTGVYYVDASWHQDSTNTFYGVTVGQDIKTVPVTQLVGTGTNNTFILEPGPHAIDGGAGVNVVKYSGPYSNYSISTTGNTVSITDKTVLGGVDKLINVERVSFSDRAIAFDTAGNGGEAYRVYQAAFNRNPDVDGLGFWMNALDQGATLVDVGSGFVASAEFKAGYGENPSNAEIVNKFYQNVLHRAGDSGGIAFWNGLLDQHRATVADVLVGFSESPENQAALIGVLQNGFAYTLHT